MSPPPTISLEDVIARVRERANAYDQSGAFPAEDLADLAAAGAMRWAVPAAFGGEALDALEHHLRYERIAAASMATALVLTQRDAAVWLIDAALEAPMRSELLAQLAENAIFATVGIAQLATSRQGGPPALGARAEGDGYVLDGLVPWSTGTTKAQWVVVGAAVEDGLQMLLALPTDAPGVTIGPPMPLVALRASHTTWIRCDGVRVDRRWVLRGPVDKALAWQRKLLPLSQVLVGMGLCQGAIELILRHDAEPRRASARPFAARLARLREEVLSLSRPRRDEEAMAAAPRLRAACNELAIRATHTAVALYKGAALLADHPAQRLAREAMFLLVWSSPNPVIDATVEALSGGEAAVGPAGGG
jgi:alkylation response protein AidB-like acyl-CoA dehydrogenase